MAVFQDGGKEPEEIMLLKAVVKGSASNVT